MFYLLHYAHVNRIESLLQLGRKTVVYIGPEVVKTSTAIHVYVQADLQSMSP